MLGRDWTEFDLQFMGLPGQTFVMFRALMSLLLVVLPLLASARIRRSAAEVLAFKRQNECPSSRLRRGIYQASTFITFVRFV